MIPCSASLRLLHPGLRLDAEPQIAEPQIAEPQIAQISRIFLLYYTFAVFDLGRLLWKDMAHLSKEISMDLSSG
jgi:hypothetical protein